MYSTHPIEDTLFNTPYSLLFAQDTHFNPPYSTHLLTTIYSTHPIWDTLFNTLYPSLVAQDTLITPPYSTHPAHDNLLNPPYWRHPIQHTLSITPPYSTHPAHDNKRKQYSYYIVVSRVLVASRALLREVKQYWTILLKLYWFSYWVETWGAGADTLTVDTHS